MQHNQLPQVRGKYRFNVSLSRLSFFKVGGMCDIMFSPADINDLLHFLLHKPSNLSIAILGNMSNVLISDFGITGCVIRLDNLNKIDFLNDLVEVQAGTLLSNFINKCANKGISCCEKLCCIPGTIGGALYMNAGIPAFEINDVLVSISGVTFSGKTKTISKDDLKMTYRNGNIPDNFIITSAKLKTYDTDKNILLSTIEELRTNRLKSQPIGERTCGSTFKNPDGAKAWKLIQQAGCNGLSVGGAKVSEKHCNFLINTGDAKASDFVKLIRIIKTKVRDETGYELEEEIKRIGEEW